MIELSITPEDLQAALSAANGRQDYAESKDFKSHGEAIVSRDKERRNHIAGCIGEIKCAQYFKQKFEPSIGVITNVDCKLFEVRARRIETGRDLAIRPNCKLRLPHVLVWISRDRKIVTLVGWLCAWEGRERAKEAQEQAGRDIWWQPLTGAWFIPPPYHSIRSLQDWINCGHPLHWCPEQYQTGGTTHA
jgi:hypothetical protein